MHPAHRGYRDLGDYRRNQVRYGIAFATITAICFAATLVSSEDVQWGLYLGGWALALACVGLAWANPALWLLAPFGALGGAILVRAGTDGLDAGIGPLLLIPMLAVAVYGSRRALIAMIACVAGAVIIGQLVWDGGNSEMSPIWRQDIVLAMLATALGVAMQDLVTRMRSERNLAEERGRIIEELALTDPLTGIDNRRGWASRFAWQCWTSTTSSFTTTLSAIRPGTISSEGSPSTGKSGPGSKTTSPDTAARSSW
jgi:hypothetical protein